MKVHIQWMRPNLWITASPEVAHSSRSIPYKMLHHLKGPTPWDPSLKILHHLKRPTPRDPSHKMLDTSYSYFPQFLSLKMWSFSESNTGSFNLGYLSCYFSNFCFWKVEACSDRYLSPIRVPHRRYGQFRAVNEHYYYVHAELSYINDCRKPFLIFF